MLHEYRMCVLETPYVHGLWFLGNRFAIRCIIHVTVFHGLPCHVGKLHTEYCMVVYWPEALLLSLFADVHEDLQCSVNIHND